MSSAVYRMLVCLLAVLVLQGCALGIDNPFSSPGTDVGEVYYDQFPDIPIPRDLTVDRSRSLVSSTVDGAKVGLVTAEGNVEMLSLTSAMAHNMTGQGWALRSATTGPRMMQIYEKDNRYAVLYYYEQTLSAAMEMWVGTRLPEGALSPPLPSGTVDAALPSLADDPLFADPGVGAASRPLSE